MLEWLALQPDLPELPPVAALEVVRPLERQPWFGMDLFSAAREQQVPEVTGRAYVVGDVATGEVLLSHREGQMMPIASLTKVMTVVVALERFGPDTVVTVSEEAAETEGSSAGLLAGDRLTVRELVKASIIRSGNDAAVALADHAPGGWRTFVGWMNEKAASLELDGMHFANPMGFDAPGHYGTAEDLFQLSRYAVQTHPEIQEAAMMERTEVVGAARTYPVETTNALLGDTLLEVLGLKTGTTEGAGQSLITLVKTAEGREMLTVMLGSSNRFEETKTLIWWLGEKNIAK